MGAGGIAHRFARSLGNVEGASLVALSGRNAARLDAFAGEFPVEASKRYCSEDDDGERAHRRRRPRGGRVHFDFAGDAGEYRVECRVTCERGEVSIPMFHRPTGFTVRRYDGSDPSCIAGERVEAPLAVDDFYDEISHVCELIRAGATESPIMPVSSTIRAARIIDAMRAAWPAACERVVEGESR